MMIHCEYPTPVKVRSYIRYGFNRFEHVFS